MISATVIIACVAFNKISSKLGIPMLLAFIVLGMIFGSDGLIKIPFEDYNAAEQICSIALIFIMFYGGFGTKWSEAKPVAAKAIILSSAGTVLTAGLVGLFCWLVLKVPAMESFLIGSVISSTDAASVFSVLRSKRLNLRYGTASLLEVESGSNDPFSYMLTVLFLSLMNGTGSAGNILYLLFAQIVYGVAAGVIIAVAAYFVFKKFKFSSAGFDAIFMVAVAIIAYAAPAALGGNGYLSAYIAGIILGNCRLHNKKALVNFFDGATGLMQMLLFFLLGLLAFPSRLPEVMLKGFLIALFLTFAARPLAVFSILTPFKSKIRQQLLVSWAGMRGAASIVFAIMTATNSATAQNDIFHIVFFIVLFSILLQGSLIPFAAKKLKMTDDESDVMKTFTDYSDEVPVKFIRFSIPETHYWNGKKISEIHLPPECILVLLLRGPEKVVPNGKTVLQAGDTVILSGREAEKTEGILLYERLIDKGDALINKTISEATEGNKLIIMIRRGNGVVIPRGSTRLKKGDILVINDTDIYG